MFSPKLITILKEGYSLDRFLKDLQAGIIVGIVALPLAIAFAIASGVSPDKGLITAVIAGFLISVLGGSRVQVGGPTGAFIVIVYGVVAEYGIDGLIISTFLAGVLLILFGLFKMGNVIKFIPYPLTIGFTSGIALLIFSSQLKDFFGLPVDDVPAGFVQKIILFAGYWNQVNWFSLVITAVTILLVIYFPKISRKIPGSLVAILVVTFVVQYFQLPVDTIESKFNEIPSSIPMPVMPNIDLSKMGAYLAPAFAIALLGGIESLLSAVVADGMTGGNHRSNTELIAQGVANCASAVFGGIPATGAIARTATNIKNGATTPIAGIVHAITLLLIMLFFGQWAKLIPMAVLAGILTVVAYNMSEWRSFRSVLKGPRNDIMVLLVTFFLTVFFDLTIAIEIGMVLAMFLFMQRMVDASHIQVITDQPEVLHETGNDAILQDEPLNIPENVEVYEINGPFFFGVAHKFKESIRVFENKPKVLIIRMRHVPFIDATGVHNFKQMLKGLSHSHIQVVLSGVKPEVKRALIINDIMHIIPEENICDHISNAVIKSRELIEKK